MSLTPPQAVKDATSSLGGLFESIIGKVVEDIEAVETGDVEIYDTIPPIMVDSVITWGEIYGDEAVSVVAKTKIGGLFIDETITNKGK